MTRTSDCPVTAEDPMTAMAVGITSPSFRDAVDALMGGHRHPLVVDARAAGALDWPSRKELVHRNDFPSAVAVIVNTRSAECRGTSSSR